MAYGRTGWGMRMYLEIEARLSPRATRKRGQVNVQ